VTPGAVDELVDQLRPFVGKNRDEIEVELRRRGAPPHRIIDQSYFLVNLNMTIEHLCRQMTRLVETFGDVRD
jgi:hypothetical protein